MRAKAAEFFQRVQDGICAALEQEDGNALFREDLWQRPDGKTMSGGGGRTRVLAGGDVFEQAGVNFSEVHGTLPSDMSRTLTGLDTPQPFFATGISLVIHPFSPLVPTTHANYRYLEVGSFAWFGGGADLTPYYIYEEDAEHFHRVLKTACDRHDSQHYPKFKAECDRYFYLPHRGETRGVGGIFFDYVGKDGTVDLETVFSMVQELAQTIVTAYLPIVQRRKSLPFTEREKSFQLLRRGRYVEFNLLFDRGTLFGLKTGGRTESILMSLPPEVRWEYDFRPEPGSREAHLLEVLSNPRDWV
ncbi:MAG: oxygen-dependent coproporphyrinogen oxidase [Bdellovibrionota bacterium]